MRSPQTLPDWLTVEQLEASVSATDGPAVFLVHDRQGTITGLLRMADFGRRGRRHREQRLRDLAMPLSDAALADVNEPLVAVLNRQGGGFQVWAIVCENQRPVGVVSPADLARLKARREIEFRRRMAHFS